jgi:hypothetical protein
MLRKKLVLSLLAVMLAAPGIHAQTAPSAAPAAAPTVENAVNPGSIQALKDMGAHLQTLVRFSVSTELTGERVLTDGQKLQHLASAELDAHRPNRLRARMFSARAEREIFYDGKLATIYIPAQKAYSTVEFTGNLGELISKLEQRYGVEIPLSDLFLWGTPAAPLDKIDSAMNAGQDFIGKDLCDHYAFRQGDVDWQIWITTGSKPLPRKLVITNRSDEARPQSVSLIDWNLKPTFKDSVFKFTPPKGAMAVELHSLEKGKGVAK